jgi:hypothetical protein
MLNHLYITTNIQHKVNAILVVAILLHLGRDDKGDKVYSYKVCTLLFFSSLYFLLF